MFMFVRKKSLIILLGLVSAVLMLKTVAGIAGIIPTVTGQSSVLVESLTEDTTGDGRLETIWVRGVGSEYQVEVEHAGGEKYNLNPELGSLAPYQPSCPLIVCVLDINNDKKPEIIIRATCTHDPPTYIFQWDEKEYKILFSGDFCYFWFRDADGDGTLEVVAEDRFVSSTTNVFVYRWFGKGYRPMDYYFSGSYPGGGMGGYHLIEGLLKDINLLWPTPEKIMDNSFEFMTRRWKEDTEGKKALAAFCKNLVAVQLGQVLSCEQAGEIVYWELHLRVFRNNGGRVVERTERARFWMKKEKDRYLIDKTRFI